MQSHVTDGAGAKAAFLRASGLAGLGFAALLVLGNAILVPAGLPSPGSETSDAVEFLTKAEGAIAVSSGFTPLVWALGTLFGAGAISVLWRPDRDRGEAWSLVGFAGLLMQNGTFAAVIALRVALAATTPAAGSVAGLWALHDALITLNGTFLALALTGLSVSGRRAGLLGPWHARLGFLSAALMFGSATLAALVVDDAGPLGLLGLAGWLLWVAWIAFYGNALLRKAPRTGGLDEVA